MVQIANKTVIVTGAGRGIGAEFVRQFAQRGNTIIATVRSKTAADNLKKIDGVTTLELDVAIPESIERWADEVAKITDHVDVVVNNAGVLTGSGIESITAEEMMRGFQINAIGPLLVSQQLLKRGLLGGKQGSIIANVTSKVGSVDDNGSGGMYAYRASKSALNNINKSMSIDLQHKNIRSVLLHPGWVRTDMTRNNGLIDTQTSVSGMLENILESSDKELNGGWWDYKGIAIPW